MPHFKVIFLGIGFVIFFFVFLFGGGMQKPIVASYYYQQEEKITFDKDIKPIMNTYCGGLFCHHGKPSAWTKYETTKASVDKGTFYERVIEKRDMPKRKELPEREYELIKKWLKNGAPEK